MVLGACSTPNTDIAPILLTETPANVPVEADEEPFRIIGYVTQAANVETIPFEQITHINYAFLIPKADGTFEMLPNGWKLEKLVSLAHDNNVKVLISVGGWGWDAEFEALAANPDTTENFCPGIEILC